MQERQTGGSKCGMRMLLMFAALSLVAAGCEQESAEITRNDASGSPSSSVPISNGEARRLHVHEVRQPACDVTWMSVDVSSDGERLAFDALGDIYVLPATGGQARRLTVWDGAIDEEGFFRGKPFSAQPVFSPDGTRIAFVSDRTGSDNIWVSSIDGAEMRAITRETEVRLASPRWMPDGSGLVVRRGTDRKGEIWLYGLDGTAEALTSSDDIIDIEGPVPVSDTEILFSAPDVQGPARPLRRENWQVFRLLLDTGEIQQVTRAPGGAVRPMATGGGEWLSFATWRDERPALIARQTATGHEQVIYGVERNLQDLYISQLDLFPGYAFTPGAASLVVSLDGEIAEIDLASGDSQVIPCQLSTNITLASPDRPNVKLPETSVPVKMLRWPQLAPNGQSVFAEAVGSIWRIPIEQGALGVPEELVGSSTRAAQPHLSAAGDRLLYVKLGNGRAGAIMEMDVAAEATRLVAGDDAYLAPRYAPDGETIVAIRETGARSGFGIRLRNRDIIVIAPDGAETRLASDQIGDEGVFPIKGDDGPAAIYLSGDELKRISLADGQTETLGPATGIDLVVPDASGERFAVVRAGKTEIVQAVDTLAGEPVEAPYSARPGYDGFFPVWMPEGDLIYTFAGDILRTSPDNTRIAYRGPVEVSLKVAGGVVAYEGARLITMGPDGVIEDGVLLVSGNRITSVGRAGEIAIPADAKRVNLTGLTITPGLIDVHQHALFLLGEKAMTNPPGRFIPDDLLLAFGITATRDPALGNNLSAFSTIEAINAGRLPGPRTFASGERVKRPEIIIETRADAEAAIADLTALGATVIKQYLQPRRDQRQWVAKAAAAQGIRATFEGGYDYKLSITAALDGYAGTEHSAGNVVLRSDSLALIAASGIDYTPTIMTQIGADRFFREDGVAENPVLARNLPPPLLQGMIDRPRRGQGVADAETAYDTLVANGAALARAGVTVGVGSHDQPAPSGLGTHWEMWSLVDGGLSPTQALKAATIDGAHIIGIEAELGSLEAGKRADFAVFAANPVDDIRNSKSIEMTVLDGVIVYDDRTLGEGE